MLYLELIKIKAKFKSVVSLLVSYTARNTKYETLPGF